MPKRKRVHSLTNSTPYEYRNWTIGDSASYNQFQNKTTGRSYKAQPRKALDISNNDMILLKNICKNNRKKFYYYVGNKIKYAELIAEDGDEIIICLEDGTEVKGKKELIGKTIFRVGDNSRRGLYE